MLTLGILFSSTVSAEVIVKSLILDISVLILSTLVLGIVLVVNLVISGSLSSIFLMSALYSVFLTTSFFY